MTRGQRALIGWTTALLLGCALWAALFTVALAQRAPVSYRGPVQITVQFTDAQNVESLCGMITNGRLHSVEACANERVTVSYTHLTLPTIYSV